MEGSKIIWHILKNKKKNYISPIILYLTSGRINNEKQEVRLFYRTNEKQVDDVINEYLSEHPNYEIERIAFDPQFDRRYGDRVLVVFNIRDPPTTAVAVGGKYNKIG